MTATTSVISVKQLAELKSSGLPHQLIDIRETYEVETCTIGGTHIPMAEIPHRLAEISHDMPVIVHCKSGKRSLAVVEFLHRAGFTHVQSLEGGILGWIDTIDPTLERY